ncbi:MAG: trehalose-6-phosphate synthase, partial [Candidatus Omnitrophica bacterium]|nr:trehalose-6-phosphate synthase [Candidatus Omnitrophota bacterium]
MQEQMADYLLVAVSNRQPFSHVPQSGKLVARRQPGGVVTALMPVMEAVHGKWIAVGSSMQDRRVLDEHGKIQLPAENPSYELRRLFLSKEEMDAYYYGYCNEGLWPLSHVAYTRPVFRVADWQAYEKVNQRFAEAILEEVGDKKAFVWVQDFHLIHVAKYLKQANQSNIITALFWHIPWPNAEVFSICPQKKEILEGMLAYDLLGFQIRNHCENFMATVDKELESRIDRENTSVFYQNKETLVRPFPISVDFQAISGDASSDAVKTLTAQIRDDYSLNGKKLLVSVDRIDYTKGIPDKLRAIDHFLKQYPEYASKSTFKKVLD